MDSLKKSTSGLLEVCAETQKIRRAKDKPVPDDHLEQLSDGQMLELDKLEHGVHRHPAIFNKDLVSQEFVFGQVVITKVILESKQTIRNCIHCKILTFFSVITSI